MVGSQIQQATSNSTQTGSFHLANSKDILQFIEELKSKILELQVDSKTREELEAEISTVEAQSKSWPPKKAIIFESLHSIRNIFEGMTGSILASQLLEHLATLIH